MAIKYVICFVFFFLIYSQWGFAEQKLVFVGDDDNFPVCYENDIGEIVGIDIDVIREMARRAGLDVNFRLMPWARALSMIEKGEAHGGFPLFVTPQRLKYSLYTKVPVHRVVMNAYVKPGNEFKLKELSDLYEKVIGINRDFSISPQFDIAVKEGKLKVYEVDEVHQLVEMVLKNRFEVLVAKRSSVEGYLKKSGKKLTALGSVNSGQGAFLVISKAAKIKNKKQLLKKIDEVMLEMQIDGTIAKITKSYLE